MVWRTSWFDDVLMLKYAWMLIFFEEDVIYLFILERMRERDNARTQVGGRAEEEGQADYLLSTDPNAELRRRTLRS